MADGSLHVQGMTTDEVRHAVDEWRAGHDPVDVMVRKGPGDRGLTTIDVFDFTEDDVRRVLTSLVPLFDVVAADVPLEGIPLA